MRVGVVGAGITGLALTHHLDRRGVESVVLEAAAEPGGVVRSARVDGHVVERGPQRTRLTPAVRDLVEAAGLADAVVEAADVPLYVYRDGRLRRVPTTLRGAITTDLVSVRGKLRALAEPLAGPPRAGETVQGYLSRALGREVAEHAVGPIYGGLYGTHPDEMYVERTLGRALSNAGISGSLLGAALRRANRGRSAPPVVSFEDGMGALPRALYARHRESIRLGTPARGLERDGDGYAIETDDGRVRVDEVVLTVPAGAAADLLEGLDPHSTGALGRLAYNPMAAVALRADADLRGAGYQVPFGEPLRTLGTTWNDSLFGRDGVYTCYVGGGKDPGLVDASDERLGAIAAREFETVTGFATEPFDVHRIRPGVPAFDTTWTALDDVSPSDGVHLCTNYTARAGIPGRAAEAERLAARLAGAAEREGPGRRTPDPPRPA